MPKYVFQCSSCTFRQHKYVPSSVESLECPECKNMMNREMPNLAGPAQVTETIDSYTGATVDQNHAEQVKQRRDDYYWNVEVPRLVQKYSVETCIENRWLVYDEKGNLVINKPPSKR